MIGQQHLFQSIYRAITAEEKQGFINTGAAGSFSGYLADTIPELDGKFAPEMIENLKAIALTYGESSPLKRRGLMVQIKEMLSIVTSPPTKEAVSQGVVSISNRVAPKEKLAKPVPIDDHALQYVKGVGPQRAIQLGNLGIKSLEDLLKHFPRRYETRNIRRIDELTDGEHATIAGKVTGSQISRGRIKVIRLNIEQDHRSIHAIWFNQVHIVKQFPLGTEVTVTGKVRWNKRIPELLATDITKGIEEESDEKIFPIYPETARLNSKALREIMRNAILQLDRLFPEIFPPGETDLMERKQSFREIHFPSSKETLTKARARLVVEEILFLQLAIARMRSPSRKEPSPILDNGQKLVERFISELKFRLTHAQQRVIQEIFSDMASKKGMTRLVQGDVGSGKTVVAMTALLQAVGSGFQAAMMAPTEVLAQQHYESLSQAFKPLGVQVALLIGSQTKSEREYILNSIVSGKAHVTVGTHALIQQAINFKALGLVVTDEQHRFGVRQRTQLQQKGENPHVLVMTATPIPRTLALTAYGDLQLSVIDEMPAGRKPVITKKITERNRSSLEKFMDQQIIIGRQIYIVCPLVEETEKIDLVSATQRAEALKQSFKNREVVLLHGRMKAQEKDDIMRRFRRGNIDILVATTVIEVGVNVPNASVMVIEDAQRFGLAQLHQLRGRVGRGVEQSYCILISDVRDSARLNILCETEDGFRIAEEDLKIRGPGELLGLRQHGVPELKLTDLTKDGRLIEYAYRLLQRVLADPHRFADLNAEIDRVHPKEKIGLN